jgi:uncharacterized membrane protein YidH (DUF202 family)
VAPESPEVPGTQVERTALAWQRTALSVLAGSLILARLTLDDLGPVALVALALALALSGWVLLRSRPHHHHRGGAGSAAAALSAAIALLCLTELVALLVG